MLTCQAPIIKSTYPKLCCGCLRERFLAVKDGKGKGKKEGEGVLWFEEEDYTGVFHEKPTTEINSVLRELRIKIDTFSLLVCIQRLEKGRRSPTREFADKADDPAQRERHNVAPAPSPWR
jgi:hypothetical protein